MLKQYINNGSIAAASSLGWKATTNAKNALVMLRVDRGAPGAANIGCDT